MRAAVLGAFGGLPAVEDVELLPPGPRDVVVRAGAVEVCVTDSYALRPGPLFHLPAILGHSAAGVVEEVGSGVTTVAPGDRVVVAGTPACGGCGRRTGQRGGRRRHLRRAAAAARLRRGACRHDPSQT